MTTHHHVFFIHLNKKNMEKENRNSIFQIIIGILLTPILIALYFADKTLLVLLPHLQSETIMKWFGNIDKIGQSALRIIAVVIIYLVAQLFIWLF